MKTLLEQMKQYAGIIEEDCTIQQIGVKIPQLLNKGMNQAEINKSLDTLITPWIKQTKVGNTLQISIHPKDYNGTMGNIDDLIVANCQNKEAVRRAFRNWIAYTIQNIKKDNPKLNVVLQGRTKA